MNGLGSQRYIIALLIALQKVVGIGGNSGEVTEATMVWTVEKRW